MSSYLVIARKYRPQRFGDLMGQEHIAVTLLNQVKTGRQAQAYLFTGPRGVGKTSAARLLAKAIRCLNPGPDHEPCNVCPACEGVNNGSSMDVLEIDAASNTGVDNVRELRENVNYAATIGKYRVYIIDEVHMLSTAAFNALLKTVEEPPPHVVFIFATTELHKVPATIQSRCQRFDFRKIPPEVMMESLRTICATEGVKFEDGALRTITVESEGCMRDAQSLLDQAIAFCGKDLSAAKLEAALGLMDRASLFELATAIGEHDPARALRTTSNILTKGGDPKVLLARLVDFLCDLHYRAFTNESRQPDPQQDPLLSELVKKLAPDEIVRAMELALRTQASLHTNVNAAITVEALVVKLCLQRPLAMMASAGAPTTSSSGGGSSSGAPMPSRFSAPAPSAPATPTRATAPAVSAPSAPTPAEPAPSASGGGSSDIGVFAEFIRVNKPAWTPVLNSLVSIENRNGTIHARAKNDFAGKRLSSPDGIAILKQAYKVDKAVVDLETLAKGATPPPSPVETMQNKRTLAREHEAVKSALKVFDATITETKVLEDERPNRSKGAK